MTKQEIDALGQAMMEEHGLSDWKVRPVNEQDDMGDEDDIAGRYGRAFHEEELIWVNMRYADDRTLEREVLLHEVAHALLGQREGDQHGEEFRVKLREIGGSLVEASRKMTLRGDRSAALVLNSSFSRATGEDPPHRSGTS
jgi:hypothetical protein